MKPTARAIKERLFRLRKNKRESATDGTNNTPKKGTPSKLSTPGKRKIKAESDDEDILATTEPNGVKKKGSSDAGASDAKKQKTSMKGNGNHNQQAPVYPYHPATSNGVFVDLDEDVQKPMPGKKAKITQNHVQAQQQEYEDEENELDIISDLKAEASDIFGDLV